jgi:hypothetical protein
MTNQVNLMNTVIVKYNSLESFLDKLIEQEKIVDNWLEENSNFHVFVNSYIGESGFQLIETIIIKKEEE